MVAEEGKRDRRRSLGMANEVGPSLTQKGTRERKEEQKGFIF